MTSSGWRALRQRGKVKPNRRSIPKKTGCWWWLVREWWPYDRIRNIGIFRCTLVPYPERRGSSLQPCTHGIWTWYGISWWIVRCPVSCCSIPVPPRQITDRSSVRGDFSFSGNWPVTRFLFSIGGNLGKEEKQEIALSYLKTWSSSIQMSWWSQYHAKSQFWKQTLKPSVRSSQKNKLQLPGGNQPN